MDELAQAKQAIRSKILEERRALPEDERVARSRAICRNIEGIPEYAAAESILFYMPVHGEADILPLLTDALRRGKRCALPKCAEGRKLRLFFISDPVYDTAEGAWGIPEPVGTGGCECTDEQFSVILVPGVAFDLRGRRIGHGAGYYDRLLCGAAGSLLIAPAYSFQVLRELPAGPWDRSVDIVATEENTFDCRRAGGSTDG